MLTIEIRVNGSIVTAMSAINTLRYDASGANEYSYRGTTFPINHNSAPQVFKGFLHHKRVDGIETLAEKLCRAAAAGGDM